MMQEGKLRHRECGCIFRMGYEPAFNEVRVEKNAVVAWITRNNAIEILRIALCLTERLLTPGRTAGEVGVCGSFAIKSSRQELRILCENVRASIGPVTNLLGMAFAKCEPVALVAGIRASDCESSTEAVRHFTVGERAGIATVAGTQQFAVPGRGGRATISLT